MKRRTFVAAALLAPAWLRRAFADASLPTAETPEAPKDGDLLPDITTTTGDRRGPADVGRALKRASLRGRPLAVIVVPENEDVRSARQQVVGDFLRSAPLEKLAPLGTADVICATLSSLRKAKVALGPRIDDETIFVRVHPDGTARSYGIKSARLTTAHVATAAAALFPLDDKSIEERRSLGRVAQRLREGPLPGGNWGYYEGCGHRAPADAAPTDDAGAIGCGMGSVGGTAHRFLAFYVEEGRRTR